MTRCCVNSNAAWFSAPWETPMEELAVAPFTTAAGERVEAPMLATSFGVAMFVGRINLPFVLHNNGLNFGWGYHAAFSIGVTF